jgi:hypothetical protein
VIKLRQYIKYLIGTAFIIFIILYIIANHSSIESSYECSGHLLTNGNKTKRTIYIDLNQYRSWVSLWSWNNRDGYIDLESPNIAVANYNYIKNYHGDPRKVHIFKDPYGKNLIGNFSMRSKFLSIDLEYPKGFFEGKCSRVRY